MRQRRSMQRKVYAMFLDATLVYDVSHVWVDSTLRKVLLSCRLEEACGRGEETGRLMAERGKHRAVGRPWVRGSTLVVCAATFNGTRTS